MIDGPNTEKPLQQHLKTAISCCTIMHDNSHQSVTYKDFCEEIAMSPNRRILLNIVATYGRSLYALMCGLFISRWVMVAGKSEFGVRGVVGGMMVIEWLAGAMRRGRDGFAAGDRQ